MENIKSITDFNRVFPTDKEMYEFLMKNGFLQKSAKCIKCGKNMSLRYKRGNPEWRCRLDRKSDCSTRSVKSNSWFAYVSIPIRKAVGIVVFHCLGYSSKQIVRELKVSATTLVDYKNFIRCLCEEIEKEYGKIGGVDDICELDETALHTRKYGRGEKERDLTWVLGGISRGTKKVFARIVDDRTAKTMIPIIRNSVDENSVIFTDMWKSYGTLKKYYKSHMALNHSVEFKRTDEETGTVVCTNNIESFWKRMKVPLRVNGTSAVLLASYISEAVVRQNEGRNFMTAILEQIKKYVG